MFAVMGITGQVGGAVARTLLQAGHAVRGIVRNPAKAAGWTEKGATLAVADQTDPAALTAALAGVEGAFVMLPANFAPLPDFGEALVQIDVLRSALLGAAVPRVVCLSSIGGHLDHGLGIITQLHLLEQGLATLPMPLAFLRPGWFMENATWDVQPAFDTGRLASFLQPLDRPFPMVATDDVGRVAAETLARPWSGRRVIELEGPDRYTPLNLATALSAIVRRPVRAAAVPRAEWSQAFEAQGAPAASAALRAEMLDGFNSGHIEFAGGPDTEHLHGRVTLDQAVAQLVSR
jgi:NAD(P)H dehydrogenase (quinone)